MRATCGHRWCWASSEKGTGVPENPSTAAKWYQKGMDNGNAAAIRRLSEMYRLGTGVPHDEKKARELLTRAEELGDKAAPKFKEKQDSDRLNPKPGQDISAEAYRLYKQKQFEQAAKLFRQCADMGNDVCQLRLGIVYEYGEGVPKNESQAVAWYRKSADQGNPIGQKTLGLMYELGKGVPEDWAEAARLYAKSAEKYEDSAFALARMYEFGMSVPQDRARAIEWFKKAGDLGHPKGDYWARWLNDYTNCIGFRDAQEQQTLGFLRCPADPVGVIFRNSRERLMLSAPGPGVFGPLIDGPRMGQLQLAELKGQIVSREALRMIHNVVREPIGSMSVIENNARRLFE